MAMNDKIKPLLKSFAIKAVLLFIGWQVLYYAVILPDGRANSWLTEQVVSGTKWGLELFGYETTYDWVGETPEDSGRYVFIDGQPVVLVADACNGLELMVLFMGFLLCFPGTIKHKLWMIPLGTIMVFIVNVIREIILALNYKFFQDSFDFNHKYTYVLVVYCCVFLLWRFWLNRYSAIGKNISHG